MSHINGSHIPGQPILGPLALADEAATARLAAQLASVLRIGDTLLLSGQIGAGKSAFARALIRERLGNPAEEVPSPTFTLVQTYHAASGDIWHCDLYRLTHPDEALELGIEDAFAQAICLIEWPDRLGSLAPADALSLDFTAGTDEHRVTIHGTQGWAVRLAGHLA